MSFSEGLFLGFSWEASENGIRWTQAAPWAVVHRLTLRLGVHDSEDGPLEHGGACKGRLCQQRLSGPQQFRSQSISLISLPSVCSCTAQCVVKNEQADDQVVLKGKEGTTPPNPEAIEGLRKYLSE